MPRRSKKTTKSITSKQEKSIPSTQVKELDLTKYEIARLVGLRAIQIAQGSPILVDLSEEDLKKLNYDPIKIAELELKEGKLPLKVVRKIPIRPKINFV